MVCVLACIPCIHVCLCMHVYMCILCTYSALFQGGVSHCSILLQTSNSLPFHEIHTFAMSFDAQIERAKPVTNERICSTLHHDGTRLILLHDLANYGPEKMFFQESDQRMSYT